MSRAHVAGGRRPGSPETSEEDFTPPPVETDGYQSPLLARLTSSAGKLTLDTLNTEVPVFHAGEAAQQQLDDPTVKIPARKRRQLEQAVQDGEAAKERLMLAGIPLVRHLAKKEFDRRQKWSSQVTFDDLVQEGSAGFLRGLRAFKPNSGQTSPTNYLGQWVQVEMRRNVETMDNDFGVAFDAAEKFRKIRAIRSRLIATLNREPTDAEVLEAANDPMFRGGSKMGRVKKAPLSEKSRLSARDLERERELRARVGHTTRFGTADSDDYDGPTVEDGSSIYETPQTLGNPDDVIETGARDGLAKLLYSAFDLMRLPEAQREVIARKFGLPPHPTEQNPRDISRDMHLRRDVVTAVVDAFTEEMTRAGGAFHRACAQWDAEDLTDIGLGWVTNVLGAVTPGMPVLAIASVLTDPLTPQATKPPAPPKSDGISGQAHAQFVCDYDGGEILATYPSRGEVPKTRACPRCNSPATLIRLRVID